MEVLIMIEKIQFLNVVCVACITKEILGFFFIQCENPLRSLFDDVSIRSNNGVIDTTIVTVAGKSHTIIDTTADQAVGNTQDNQ